MKKILMILFSFYLFALIGCGDTGTETATDSSLKLTSLTECPNLTPFSQGAPSVTQLAQLTAFTNYQNNDDAMKVVNSFTNNGAAPMFQISSKEEIEQNPMNILLFGVDTHGITDEQVNLLKAVLEADKCLVFDEITHNEVNCLQAKLALDLNPSELPTEEQLAVCDSLDSQDEVASSYDSYVVCGGETAQQYFNQPPTPVTMEGADTTAATDSDSLDADKCNEYNIIYKALIDHSRSLLQDDSESASLALSSTDCSGDSGLQDFPDCSTILTCYESQGSSTVNLSSEGISLSTTTNSINSDLTDDLFSNITIFSSTDQDNTDFSQNLQIITDNSGLLTISPSVTIIRTTEFYNSSDPTNDLCKEAYCDLYYFTFKTTVNTTEVSFSTLNNSLTSSTEDGGSAAGLLNFSPTGSVGYNWTSEPGILFPQIFYGDYIPAMNCLDTYYMIAGGYFDSLKLYLTPGSTGYLAGDYFPKTSGQAQVYNTSSTAEASQSFTVGAEIGVDGGENTSASGKITASYTAGTSFSSTDSTTESGMNLQGGQNPKNSIDYTNITDNSLLSNCDLNATDSSDTNCLIRTEAEISSRTLTSSSLKNQSTSLLPSLLFTYYPTFDPQTTDPLPDNVHTEDLTFYNSFVLIKPKSSIENQESEETLYIDWDLFYYYLTMTTNSVTCVTPTPVIESFSWSGSTTTPITFNYSTFPAISENQTTNLPLTKYIEDINLSPLASNVQTALSALTEETNGCTSDSLPIEAMTPAIAGWIARVATGDTDEQIATNNYSLPVIESEVECRTICYATGDCYWAKWGPVGRTDDDTDASHTTNRCWTSKDNCAQYSYDLDTLSCDAVNSNIYYSKYSSDLNDSTSSIVPYYITKPTDEGGTTILFQGCSQ